MNTIPDPLLRALADRPASRICESILLKAHEDDVRNLLERCARGHKLECQLRRNDRFPGVRSIHVTPSNLSASIRFDAPVEIHGMTLIIQQAIPLAVLTRLGSHMAPRQVVDHPFLDGLRMTRIRTEGKITRIGLKSTRKRRTLGRILADHPRATEEGWIHKIK